MAYKLLQNIIDTTGIPVMQKAVLAVLARHSLEDGTNKKSPSVQTLGDKAGMCAKAARVALRGLEEGGWIIALGKKSGGRNVTTRYLIVAGRFQPDKTRHDSPPFNEETSQESRYHVPPNGHDAACETRHEMPSNEAKSCETRYDSPLNPVPRTDEEVLEEKVSKGSLCELESTRAPEPAAAGHTQGAPELSETKSATVVQFAPPGGRSPLPVGWVLSDEWRASAEAAGQTNVDGAAARFFDFHFERGITKTAAGWDRAWTRWIDENIERGYGNGQQRHDDQRQRRHGDLASYVKSNCPRWFADAAGSSNPW